jgi:hypothetical protein
MRSSKISSKLESCALRPDDVILVVIVRDGSAGVERVGLALLAG